MRKLLTAIGLFLFPLIVFSQAQFGEIRGTLTLESAPGQFIKQAVVKILMNGAYIDETTTNENGQYAFNALHPGTYSVIASHSEYRSMEMTGVVVSPDKVTKVDFKMNELVVQGNNNIVVTAFRLPTGMRPVVPLPPSPPVRDMRLIAQLSPLTLVTNNGQMVIGATRPNNSIYLLDGVPLLGQSTLPVDAVDQVDVIHAGVPAMYGDFIGGAVSIRSKGPSRHYYRSVNMITSALFDKYGYHHIEGFFSGPLKIKHKGEELERVTSGFMFSGNVIRQKDPNPSAIGIWKLDDKKLAEIEANPLIYSPGSTGLVPAGENVTFNDMEKVKSRQNSPNTAINLISALTWQPNQDINIRLGMQYNYSNSRNFSFSNSLFNAANNSQSIISNYLGYVTFTHKLVKPDFSDGAKPRMIYNAYYTMRLDYLHRDGVTRDAEHGDNVFRYGHIGKFNTYSEDVYTHHSGGPNSEPKMFVKQNGDTVYIRDYAELQQDRRDTLTTFTRSELNRVRANYTSRFFEFAGNDVNSLNEIRQGLGLVNGDNPGNIYGLWNNVGSVQSAYSKNSIDKYTLFAMAEASILPDKNTLSKMHSLQFGLTFEQRVQRGYSLDANGLWSLMRQLQNTHLSKLDYSNPILVYDQNGVFQDTVRYNRMVNTSEQSHFDRSFRESLISNGQADVYGNAVNEHTLVDVNSYDPSALKLSMLSADELLNNGSSYVNYFGYDHLGNKSKSRVSINDFLNSPGRNISAFTPVYAAMFVQDKFTFNDITMRLGVRVDRYDANQLVLKDPYSLYPVVSAAEVKTLGGNSVTHPATIGDDYSVYVNDVDNPTSIVGYRSSQNNIVSWYNKEGVMVSDPSLLANSTEKGRIAPMLHDSRNQKLSKSSFADYKPQINVMPRIWLSFPISTTSEFFANYDVLVQRPPEGNIANIDDYFFLGQKAGSGQVINNPNLKPVRKTDYQLGFRQVLGRHSLLSLVAAYSEMRDLIQLFRYNYAYPISYTTYENMDFATVKSFRAEYELRELGNLNLTANYILQFADGTGSNSASSAALIAVGQPNLRTLFPLDFDVRHVLKGTLSYRFKEGSKYSGPAWKFPGSKKPFLQNTGASFVYNARSGQPYTANSVVNSLMGEAQRSQIKGSINGDRLPWQFTADMNIDKTFDLRYGEKIDSKRAHLMKVNVYIWIQNVLNAKNISTVYPYTGQPDDDGFMSSARGTQAVEAATNSQSLIDLYTVRAINPGFYAMPRQARVGVKVIF
jgi:hypothetical protein